MDYFYNLFPKYFLTWLTSTNETSGNELLVV